MDNLLKLLELNTPQYFLYKQMHENQDHRLCS